MWEDPSNVKGGKWVIRLRKTKIDRAWENACMAMLGEQFLVGPEICGIVLSTRFPVGHLSYFFLLSNETWIDIGGVFLFLNSVSVFSIVGGLTVRVESNVDGSI